MCVKSHDQESEKFASRLKKIITDKHLSVKQVAKRADITPGALHRIINMPRLPNTLTVKSLAMALNVTSDQLLGIDRPELSEDKLEKLRRAVARLDNLLYDGNDV
jgi:transcriptional regulator with XRE-family HTH domain